MSRLSGETTSRPRAAAPARDLHFVIFAVGEWEYAVEVADVCGIYHGLAIIPTPDEPDIVAGDIQLTTHRVRVVDVRRLMHLPERIGLGWLLVIRHAEGMIGLLVDHVSEVIRVPAHSLFSLSVGDSDTSAPGVIAALVHYRGRVIHLPDLPRLLPESLNQ